MPPDFDPAFQVPNWSWWIVLYFFGDGDDRSAMRVGHLVAFPLIILCAIFLTVDLGQPQRFWHMLFQSANFPEPIFKPYSPMSFGSAILFVFGLIAFVSFVDALFGRSGWLHAPGNPVSKIVS